MARQWLEHMGAEMGVIGLGVEGCGTDDWEWHERADREGTVLPGEVEDRGCEAA